MYLAGIYHKDSEGDCFTVLTRETEGCMTQIHSRMPLILHGEEMQAWLFSKAEGEKLLDRHFTQLQRRKSETDGYQQMSLFYKRFRY